MKHFFFDLDGTLFENNNGFDDQAMAILSLIEDSGNVYSFTTGRAKMYVDYLLRERDVSPVTISYGEGGLVEDKVGDRVLLEKCFTKEEVESLMNDEKLKASLFFLTDSCITSIGATFDKESSLYPLWIPQAPLDRVWVMQLRHISQDIFDYVEKSYDLKPCRNYGGDDISIDIGPKGISKGKALKLVIEELELDRKNVFVFGDSYNDLTNFEVEGIFSVAMYKSLDEIKNVASYVLTREEGLVGVVRRIIEGEIG